MGKAIRRILMICTVGCVLLVSGCSEGNNGIDSLIPWGAKPGRSQAIIIGYEGGSLPAIECDSSPGGLRIHPGAFSGAETVSISCLSSEELDQVTRRFESAVGRQGYEIVGAIRMEPSGLQFGIPADVTVPVILPRRSMNGETVLLFGYNPDNAQFEKLGWAEVIELGEAVEGQIGFTHLPYAVAARLPTEPPPTRAPTAVRYNYQGYGPMCTYNGYRMGWVMDYADANNIVNEVFHPDSPFQYTYWDDETFRELVDQALLEGRAATRQRLWQQAEDILINDYAALLPLFHYDRTALIRSDIEYELSPFGAPHYMTWHLPRRRDTLRVQLGTEPPTLDVNLATDITSHAVLNQLMEGPFRYDARGEVVPAGARSFELSDDGTAYTVHLRRDALWSDGEPVIALHYVDGIIRLLDPATAAEYAYVMYYISGAEAYNTGETEDPSTVGVRAVDDYTLLFTLDEPQSFFDKILAFFTMYPIRLDVIERYGDEWTEPQNFVGNGPYNLVEWNHEDDLVLERSRRYHSPQEVDIERIEFPIIIENAAALAAFERGELDVSSYPSEELARILEQMPQNLARLPRPGTYYVGFNTALPPTDNLNMRRALSSAVDRRGFLDNVLEMPWRIEACGVIPPEVSSYRGCGEVGFEFDLDAAQQHLEAAMAEMGIEDPSEITVQLWFNRGNEEVISSVEQQWEANLGIVVTVVNMEWGVYLETLDICNN